MSSFDTNEAIVTRMDQPALSSAVSNSFYSGEPSAEPRNNSVAKFFQMVRRFWWLGVLIWIVVAVPTVLIGMKIKPKYTCSGALRVTPILPQPVESSNSANSTPAPQYFEQLVNTQEKLIVSPEILLAAAKNPELQRYEWFTQLPDQVGYLSALLQVGDTNTDQVKSPLTLDELVPIVVEHEDAAAGAAIINVVLDTYKVKELDKEQNDEQVQLDVVKNLLVQENQGLADAQQALNTVNHGQFGTLDDQRHMTTDLLSGLKTNYSKLIGDRLNLQAERAALESQPAVLHDDYVKSVDVEKDDEIVGLRQDLVRIQSLLIELMKKENPTAHHPDVVQYNKQIAELNVKINDRIHEVQETAWGEYAAAQNLQKTAKLQDLDSQISGLDQQIKGMDKQIADEEQEANRLSDLVPQSEIATSNIEKHKTAIEKLEDREKELQGIIDIKNAGRVSIAWHAVPSKTPDYGTRIKVMGGGVGGGLFLAMGMLFVISRMRNRIDNPEDLPDNMQTLIVGTVSHAGESRNGLQGKLRRKILGEEMRLVHANLLPPGTPNRRIIMVTSPTPGNGKTSIASHLALSLAKSGLNVLLIDGDLRKRDLSSMFDTGFKPGMAELLQGLVPEIIHPVELLQNFSMIGAGGQLGRNPAELFQRKHVRESLDQLQEKYDCIVIDTPPTLVVADARLVAGSCDEVLVVVRAQVSSTKEVNQTVDALTRVTGTMPKIIINGVQHGQQYYKYKFTYASGDVISSSMAGAGTASSFGDSLE